MSQPNPAACPQPNHGRAPKSIKGAKDCQDGGYCLCRIYADAQQRCIDRSEGWRWGIVRPQGKA